jgi:hypothetical protein
MGVDSVRVRLRQPARRRPVAPKRPAPSARGGSPLADTVLNLQATAGNRAVVALLSVQRDPPQNQDPTSGALMDVPLSQRLTEAKTAVTSGGIDASAFERFRTSDGTAADVAQQLWKDELTLWDVDAAYTGVAAPDAKKAKELRTLLLARVNKAVAAKLNDLIKQVPSSRALIDQQIEKAMPDAPMWADGSIADRLYEDWVGPAPIKAGSPSGAVELWSTLRQAARAPDETKRNAKLSPAAIAALPGDEHAAVRDLLTPMSVWVVTPEDTNSLTDQVATKLGRPVGHTDPSWQELRGRMATLIHAAETEIINKVIPQGSTVLTPALWARFRNLYVATITKTMWAYYNDNIVDANILGETYFRKTDNSGMHKDVVAVLPLLEESAMRLGSFASRADLMKAKQRPGSEFRLEAATQIPWMSRAKHLSFHGTGRAMDFRAGTNPSFGGATQQLVSILGGGDLSELPGGSTQQRLDLQQVATHNADVVQFRATLQARLAAATDPAEKAQLTADLDRIAQHLRDNAASGTLTGTVRGRAADSLTQVKAIESNFLQTWAEVTILRSLPFVGDELAMGLINAQADAAADAAKAALDAAVASKSPQAGMLRERVRRIEEVRTLLANPRAATADGTTRAGMLAETGKIGKSGITDMPSWLVQAFAESGWQWGMWPGFSDAMHFDYMGPVADVRSEAQYL